MTPLPLGFTNVSGLAVAMAWSRCRVPSRSLVMNGCSFCRDCGLVRSGDESTFPGWLVWLPSLAVAVAWAGLPPPRHGTGSKDLARAWASAAAVAIGRSSTAGCGCPSADPPDLRPVHHELSWATLHQPSWPAFHRPPWPALH